MKRMLCCVLIAVIVFSLSSSVYASTITNTEDPVPLSHLSDDACIAFLKENGVEIPPLFDSENMWAGFIRSTIQQVEENPNVVFAYGYTVICKFANDIKQAVNEHYGVNEATVYGRIASMNNILVDNTVVGTWDDSYEDYNCYAYAIGDTVGHNPGYYHWVSLDNDPELHVYNWYANIYTIATWIESDLECLGYTVNSVTTTMPSTEVDAHNKLICVRKDTDGVFLYNDDNGDPVYFYDYHLMKLSTNGSWYHKPGPTNPLQYKYTPNSSVAWVDESYDGTFYERNTSFDYDSTIYFIEYTSSHKWSMAPTGTHQHIRTCSICHQTSGTASSCVFLNGVCRTCGRVNTGGPSINSN